MNKKKTKQSIKSENGEAYRQGLITVIGTSYVDLIVPDFLEKCFEVYCKKEFDKKQFQVSVYENTFATAGIVLTVLGFEAYRNRIYYLEKKKVGKSVAKDLAVLFKSKKTSFPEKDFEDLLSEVFVLRDVIVHNHIYKVNVSYDGGWQMLGHTQTLLEGYGDDKKFKRLASSRTKKTNSLKLNIQPGKIGFEDLLLVLIIFDLFVGLSEEILKRGYAPFHFWKEIGGKKAESLNDYITYFYNQIPNVKYTKSLNGILSRLRGQYKQYVSKYKDYFVDNICFKCGEYGFRKIDRKFHCAKCGYGIEFGTI